MLRINDINVALNDLDRQLEKLPNGSVNPDNLRIVIGFVTREKGNPIVTADATIKVHLTGQSEHEGMR